MAIVDGRTLLTNNNSTGLDDLSGAASGTADTETFIFGSASQAIKVSANVAGLLYDAGSAQDWSGNTFYIWWKCVSVADTLANGGIRVRFCGNTVTDYFEKFIDGGNTGSIDGWNMAVIDIDEARADATAGTPILGANGGTPPATTAVRYVGIVFDIPGMVSGNTDNCFVDAMWRLPANTAGIRVEGQNTGSVDWTWDDIVNAGDVSDTTKAWGTIFKEDGIIKINTPITFGANDAVTHGFSDTNTVVAWQNNLVAATFYSIDIIGGSGTQSWKMGIKSGTGEDATGSQGLIMVAETAGVRFNINANDANIDAANFYGCQFVHGGAFGFDGANTSVISNLFNDCTSVDSSGIIEFLKCSIIGPNTTDGVAFLMNFFNRS